MVKEKIASTSRNIFGNFWNTGHFVAIFGFSLITFVRHGVLPEILRVIRSLYFTSLVKIWASRDFQK